MIALDANLHSVQQAASDGAGMLLTHHPLLYRPLTRVDTRTRVGQAVSCSLENRIAIYSAHTNLDAARGGINWALADYLCLEKVQVLAGTTPGRVKLVTFVPSSSAEELRNALFAAGAGHIGAYSRCSFSSEGTGSFFGTDTTHPAAGKAGEFELVPEIRLEMILDRELMVPAMNALRDHHPYEEPAADFYSLLPGQSEEGLGLVGDLPETSSVEEISRKLAGLLDLKNARLVGGEKDQVNRLALCAGSGASLLHSAAGNGAQLFVTGDVKYHDAREAQDAGLTILDIGHFAPERYGLEIFGAMLESRIKAAGAEVQIVYAKEIDPFTTLPGLQ